VSTETWREPQEALLILHRDTQAEVTKYAVALSSSLDHRAEVELLLGHAENKNQAMADATDMFIRKTWGIPVDLYTPFLQVYQSLLDLRSNFPHVQPHFLQKATTHRLYACAREALVRTDLPPPVPQYKNVAVDGSWSRSNNKGGWSALREDGLWYIGSGSSVQNPTYTELAAIYLAVKKFKGPLRILSDCQPAIHSVQQAQKNNGTSEIKLANAVAEAIAKRPIKLEWVPSHSGMALNEGANRLAIASRRGLSAGLLDQVKKVTCPNIVAETLASNGHVLPSSRPVSAKNIIVKKK